MHYSGSKCQVLNQIGKSACALHRGYVPMHHRGKMLLPYSENECSCSTAVVGARALHQLENKCQCTTAGIRVNGRGNKRPCTTAGVSARARHQYRNSACECAVCTTTGMGAVCYSRSRCPLHYSRDTCLCTTAGISACALQRE